MYLVELEKANFLITEYGIFNYPVPIDIIEKIIMDHGYNLLTNKYFMSNCIVLDNILVSYDKQSTLREGVAHELGHALCHCLNITTVDKPLHNKCESQAKAFAAYFLMPVFVFEQDLKDRYNDYELSENFGVSIELVQYRKTLTESLINMNYFKDEVATWKKLHCMLG